MVEKVTDINFHTFIEEPNHFSEKSDWTSAIILDLDTSLSHRLLHTEYCDKAVILLKPNTEYNHKMMRVDAYMDVGLDGETEWSPRTVKTFYDHNPYKALAWVIDNLV